MRRGVEVLAARPGWRTLAKDCERLLVRLGRAAGRSGAGVALYLAPDREIRRLNRRFLGRDRVTDVLAFPAEGDLEPGRRFLGEIVVAVPRAGRQAHRARWSLAEEMALLVTHGFLHLLGHDHETDNGTMRHLEADLLHRVAGVRIDRRALPWGGSRRRPAGRRATRR